MTDRQEMEALAAELASDIVSMSRSRDTTCELMLDESDVVEQAKRVILSRLDALRTPRPAPGAVVEPVAWADREGRERPIDAEAMKMLRQNPTVEGYWSRFDIPLYTNPAPASDGAIREIASERLRQIAKGYDSSHDDAHSDGSIAMAAAAYAKEAARKSGFKRFHPSPLYPWSYSNFDEKPPRDAMIVAAALCVAEIERLDRIVLAQPPAEKEG